MSKPRGPGPLPYPTTKREAIKVSHRPIRGALGFADIETTSTTIKFTLPGGASFEVETSTRDGVEGLVIRGDDSFGIKLNVSNCIWLIPRDGKV